MVSMGVTLPQGRALERSAEAGEQTQIVGGSRSSQPCPHVDSAP